MGHAQFSVFCRGYYIDIQYNPQAVGAINILILEERKLRHGEMENLLKSPSWQSSFYKPGRALPLSWGCFKNPVGVFQNSLHSVTIYPFVIDVMW